MSGWRRAVYVGSGGMVNPGESVADAARRELIARVNQPLHGCYKIAMLSLKGGVGKTTTTTALGSTFSSLRGDRVVAVDANPDRGTLSEKIPLETTATVRHLLRDAGRIRRYSDVRAYTSQGPSRLEVLASEQDPAVSEAFSEADYRRAVALLEHFYNVVLTDCGTGLMHSAMKGVLDVADALLVVSSASIDGARSASATLDWLDAHGYRELVARSVTVINYVRPSAGHVDLDRIAGHFSGRCRAVCRLPFDAHLEQGAEIELERLSARTRTAMLELAAAVADDFPRIAAPGGRGRRPDAGPFRRPGDRPGRSGAAGRRGDAGTPGRRRAQRVAGVGCARDPARRGWARSGRRPTQWTTSRGPAPPWPSRAALPRPRARSSRRGRPRHAPPPGRGRRRGRWGHRP